MHREDISGVLRGLIPESDFAEAIGRTVRTVRNWRNRRIGPPYVRIGRDVFYRQEAIHSWLETVEIEPRGRKKEAA